MAQQKNTPSPELQGKFITDPLQFGKRLSKIRAYLFDWDGVFNDGYKNENGSSPFSEPDSMGINLLRFNHFLRKSTQPVLAILSGEKNSAAFSLAKREHFQDVYFSIKNKIDAVRHICARYQLELEQVAFVFDDVLDLSVAGSAGIRIMVPHASTSLLVDYAIRNELVDYVTHHSGREHAVRESTELLMTVGGHYDETIRHRIEFTDTYQQYLSQRNQVATRFFTADTPGFKEVTEL
ncbi:MAG TPA: hypothetical protein VLJ68_05390 [Chitinophagaceae bacterium]|nr:hypothetical protein [Chitinophagaceae bacterium]